MKSNEEFIAGIYEKAAAYQEESTSNRFMFSSWNKVLQMAAMLVICIGIAGVGIFAWRENGAKPQNAPQIMNVTENGNATETGNIAETGNVAETGLAPTLAIAERQGVNLAIAPAAYAETLMVSGVVERIQTQDNRVWITLSEDAGEEFVRGSMVCVLFDLEEPVDTLFLEGTSITVNGEVSQYQEYTQLTIRDLSNLVIWESND